MKTRVLVGALALLAASPAARAQTPPPAPVETSPADLATRAGTRLGGEFDLGALPVRASSEAERRAAAARWLDEAFAPLTAPECAPALRAAGIPAAAAAPAWPEGRPIAAAPGADAILAPPSAPPAGPDEVAALRTTGVLPWELALTGEYARLVAARKAGPPAKDPLLRLARAARLEGTARLAGIVVAARGAGVDPGSLGAAALALDRGGAGLAAAPAGLDPVRRALFRTMVDDGRRWALFWFLRAGWSGVGAALERPASGLGDLARPGARPSAAAGPATGCRLGPRGAAALAGADDDAPWNAAIVADAWNVDPRGRLVGLLAFDDEGAAVRAAADLAERGATVRRTKTWLAVSPPTRIKAGTKKP